MVDLALGFSPLHNTMWCCSTSLRSLLSTCASSARTDHCYSAVQHHQCMLGSKRITELTFLPASEVTVPPGTELLSDTSRTSA